MRRWNVILGACLLLLALAPTANAQQVKLKNLGIKGTLTSRSCLSNGSCIILDLFAEAPDELFLFVTQICLINPTNTSTTGSVAVGGDTIVTDFLTSDDTECFLFSPAYLVPKNGLLQCIEDGVSFVRCQVTGVLSKK